MYRSSLKVLIPLFFTVWITYAKHEDGERICMSKTELRDLMRQEIKEYMNNENERKYADAKLKAKLNGLNLNSTQIQKHERKHLTKRFLDMNEGMNVAFDAILSRNHEHTGERVVVKFDKVLTNIGNAYDSNLGVFQTPVAGTYLFAWTISADFTASIKTHLEKNGVAMATLHADGSTDSDHHFISSATKVSILTLGLGDRIYIQGDVNNRGTIASDSIQGHSGFSGTLLFT